MKYPSQLSFVLLAIAIAGGNAAYADVDLDLLAEKKLDWIANEFDRQQVIVHARAGSPQFDRNAPECPQEFPAAIDVGGSRLCVAIAELPDNVTQDLKTMEVSRFDNVSDYDRRITKFLTIRHGGIFLEKLITNDIRMLASLIQVNPDDVERISFSAPAAGSSGYLSALRGLYVGSALADKSSMFDYVSSIDDGEHFIQVGFGLNEVGLFPGGGYTTHFSFFISDKWLIYAKSEGWNS